MKIFLLSIFEQTPIDKVFSTRFMGIAEEAVKRGHELTFFASTFKHNTKNQRFAETTTIDSGKGYPIVFVKSLGYKSNISLKRLYAHYDFGKRLVMELNKHEKPDIILSAFPPVSLNYEVAAWAKKNNVPVIMDIIDPWPEGFGRALKFVPSWLKNLLFYPMLYRVKETLKNITAVSAISNQYVEWAKHLCPQLMQGYCFYPVADFAEMKRQHAIHAQTVEKDPQKLRVIYAGSLASAYDIPTILEAAERLYNKYGDNIQFAIAGSGPQSDLVEDYTGKYPNLTYLGRLPKDELMREYYLSDIGLTQHHSGSTQSVTYKLFDLLSNGLPIMNSLESEMKDIILDNRVGLFNKPGDNKQLAENIEYCYLNRDVLDSFRENGYRLTAEQGDSAIVYGEFVNLMEGVGNADGGREIGKMGGREDFWPSTIN